MIPHSAEYRREIAGGNWAVVDCDVEFNGRVVDTLPAMSGRVSVDAKRQVRRTLSCTLSDRDGRYNPRGGSDLLNPTVGALLRPRRGVLIQETVRLTDIYNTDTAWNTGTLTDVVTTGDGGITLASA